MGWGWNFCSFILELIILLVSVSICKTLYPICKDIVEKTSCVKDAKPNLMAPNIYNLNTSCYTELQMYNQKCTINTNFRRIYTSGFPMRFPHWVAIFYNLPWLSKTKVSYIKLQCNAVNACGNRMCKLSFKTMCLIPQVSRKNAICF